MTKRQEEIERASREKHLEKYNQEGFCPDFIAGANWQKEQMLKDTVDAEAVYMIGEGTLFNPEVLPDNIKPGDKVKLIIVKEEEK